MKNLFVVESPNKIKKISKYLGPDWIVMASVGHIRDLPANDLGVEPPKFRPKYVVSEGKTNVVSKLKKALPEVDSIYLGTDMDREGEAIAWHIYEALGLRSLGKPVKRVRFDAISKDSIDRAVANADNIDTKLVAAQEARRVLDRLVGYMVSPRLGKGLSAGRVQSPALRLVVEREEEIENFKPQRHYEVEAHMAQPMPWSAKWLFKKYCPNDQTIWQDKQTAEQIAQVSELVVADVQKKKQASRPPAPFTTSTLQQVASSQLRYSPEKTMNLAQNLFAQGAITYHRTDNPNLSGEGMDLVRGHLNKMGMAVATEGNKWKAPKGAQEAHEAIRPVEISQEKQGETDEERKLYDLIRNRALACQMPPAIYDATRIELHANVAVPQDGSPAVFVATGRVLTKERGWMALLGEGHDEESANQGDMQSLPAVQKGDRFSAKGKLLTKATQPPKRFTEASLVKKLESMEIGRPSTYAAILSNIKRRDYVLLSKRMLEPTKKGRDVINALRGQKFGFYEYRFTREMEQDLDSVAQGKAQYLKLIQRCYDQLVEELDGLPTASFGHHAVGSCDCGGEVLEREKAWSCNKCEKVLWRVVSGRKMEVTEALPLFNGGELAAEFKTQTGQPYEGILILGKDGRPAFKGKALEAHCKCGGSIDDMGSRWACKKCGSTVWRTIASRAIQQSEAEAILAGNTVQLTGFLSKAKKPFDAGLRINDSGKVDFVFEDQPAASGETKTCPSCESNLVVKRGRKGQFWGCSSYPKCNHVEAYG